MGQEKVTTLLKRSLADVPGRKVLFITVDYLPGQSTPPQTRNNRDRNDRGTGVNNVLKSSLF